MAKKEHPATSITNIFSIEEFLVERGLYSPKRLLLFQNAAQLYVMLKKEVAIHAHCIHCGKQSVFTVGKQDTTTAMLEGVTGSGRNLSEELIRASLVPGTYLLLGLCAKSASHVYSWTVLLTKGQGTGFDYTIEKVGQYPAYAQLVSSELSEFRPAFDNPAMHRELVKAAGLASHDSAVGAYTYLRRVFDYVVDRAHEIAMITPGWDENKYAQERRRDQVKMLRGFLPDFVVDNNAIYSALSVGIHQMSEDDAAQHFAALMAGVKLILHATIYQKKVDREMRAWRIPDVSKPLDGDE